MVQYRRNHVQGATYFFTVNLNDRQSSILTDHIETLRSAVRKVSQQQPLQIVAMVVLPEHLHALWTLPTHDDDYANRWRTIKSIFTRSLVKNGIKLSKNHRGEYDLWQRRFWEHTIRDETDLQRHTDYIHYNPVKHKLVRRVADWAYSSFHRYVKEGWLPKDWGGQAEDLPDVNFGERSRLRTKN